MRLHIAPNTIAVAVAITLEEIGQDYDIALVDFAQAAQTQPDYLAINPKGRVPALETDGEILTETGAILEYLAALHPGAGLVPSNPLTAAHMRSTMFYLATTMHVNHAHKMRGHRWADRPESFEDMTAKVPQTMAASAAYVESDCLNGPFTCGDVLTLADPYLFMVCSWLSGDDVDPSQFPKIQAFLEIMETRQAVKSVRQKGLLTL